MHTQNDNARPAEWKRNTFVFLGSQAVSLLGSSLVQYAITWYITLKTQSGIYMTISILCSFLPTLLMSPFAGVWADRYSRKKLIMLSDGMIALSTLVLAIIFLLGYEGIFLLFAVSAIRSLGSAVQSPSVSAMLPDMVPQEKLTRINGLNGSVQSILSLVSPALSGVLLSFVGRLELIFFIDVVTAAIAIFILAKYLVLPAKERGTKEKSGYFKEIKEGLSYIVRQRFLLHLFIFSVIIYISIAPLSFLTPLQVARNYGAEEWRLAAVEIAFSAGMLIGGLTIATWHGFKNRVVTMAVSLMAVGVFSILLGVRVSFVAYLALMLVTGLALPFFNTPAVVLLQEKVDPHYMGRVFSVLTMISSSLMPLGMLIFGPLADTMSIETLLMVSGGLILVASLAALLDKTILHAGLPGPKAGEGEAQQMEKP